MANYFVDSTNGNNADDGTTMDAGGGGGTGAWATLEYAMESGGVTAGDTIFVRRIHVEPDPADNITCQNSGTPTAPIKVIGWPRAADSSITSATWTNGSTTVDLIVGLSMDREQHLGRFITGPDGFDYIITKITDSNTIVIDREYAGSTVTGTSGAATINADEDYATAQAVDDSGWTITKADWNADADDMPTIDYNAGNYTLTISSKYHWYFANLNFTNTTSANGLAVVSSGAQSMFSGCLFLANANHRIFYVTNSGVVLRRCILVGSGAGGSQYGVYAYYAHLKMFDSAVYSTGVYGLDFASSNGYLNNVNVGVEGNCGGADMAVITMGRVFGYDVKLGQSAADRLIATNSGWTDIAFENYGKVLGSHIRLTAQGQLTKTDVVAGSGDPYKRTGGSDSVIEIVHDESNTIAALPDWDSKYALGDPILEHEFEATTDTRTYRYYVQAEGAVTAAQLWIELEYVAEHDDTSEYVVKKVISTDAIDARSGASDWSQYIEVGDITPAVASTVRVKIYCSYYHATNKIYIDPLPEVTT